MVKFIHFCRERLSLISCESLIVDPFFCLVYREHPIEVILANFGFRSDRKLFGAISDEIVVVINFLNRLRSSKHDSLTHVRRYGKHKGVEGRLFVGGELSSEASNDVLIRKPDQEKQVFLAIDVLLVVDRVDVVIRVKEVSLVNVSVEDVSDFLSHVFAFIQLMLQGESFGVCEQIANYCIGVSFNLSVYFR